MSDTLDRKFETIDKGYYCGHYSPAEYAVRDMSNWKDLWNRIKSDSFPQPAMPEVNFINEIVLGVFQGQKKSGGYDIEISNLVERDDCLEVYVKERTPGPGMVTMALTQPYHLVRTSRTGKEVKFIKYR